MPLIVFGISWLLALIMFGAACFSGKYDEQYAVYHTYAYYSALEKFKNDKHYYPPDLVTLLTQGYMDKKLSGLCYAVGPASASGGYYFVYRCLGDDFALYAKPLKNKATFFVDKTGSVRAVDADEAIAAGSSHPKDRHPVLPLRNAARKPYLRF